MELVLGHQNYTILVGVINERAIITLAETLIELRLIELQKELGRLLRTFFV